jgi:predicted dehydrogenase
MGDIGSHCQNLIEFVTGADIVEVCAELSTFVPGRQVDDDGNVLVRLDGGARGVLLASQVAFGEENALRLKVYGARGGLEWSQQEPNSLVLRREGTVEVLRTGGARLTPAAAAAARLPAGHGEGYLEAFANLYRAFADAVRAHQQGRAAPADYPGISDGVRGMRFLKAVIASSAAGGAWRAV